MYSEYTRPGPRMYVDIPVVALGFVLYVIVEGENALWSAKKVVRELVVYEFAVKSETDMLHLIFEILLSPQLGFSFCANLHIRLELEVFKLMIWLVWSFFVLSL